MAADGRTLNVAPLEMGFCVSDINRSIEFWVNALGLTFVSDIDTTTENALVSGLALSSYRVVRLQLPTGERIKLFSPRKCEQRTVGGAPPLARVGFAFLTLIVADIYAAASSLAAAGYPARHPIHQLRPGVRVALVDDPDGNVLELVQYDDLASYRSDIGR